MFFEMNLKLEDHWSNPEAQWSRSWYGWCVGQRWLLLERPDTIHYGNEYPAFILHELYCFYICLESDDTILNKSWRQRFPDCFALQDISVWPRHDVLPNGMWGIIEHANSLRRYHRMLYHNVYDFKCVVTFGYVSRHLHTWIPWST